MKKEGIQTRNRKLSSKSKRHRRNGENGLPLQLSGSNLVYDKPSFGVHSFPTSGFSSSFPSSGSVHHSQLPPYVSNGVPLSDSFMGSSQTHAFAQNSINTGYPGGLASGFPLQPSSGFGAYFGSGFSGFSWSVQIGIDSKFVPDLKIN